MSHFYFDDESWATLYLAADAEGRTNDGPVLFSHIAPGQWAWQSKTLAVAISMLRTGWTAPGGEIGIKPIERLAIEPYWRRSRRRFYGD